MRELLRHRDFRLMFAGATLSAFGDSSMLIVLGIWVKSLTGSSGQAGAVFFVLALPSLFSPLGGYLVDRVRRRQFLIVANLLSAVAMLPLLAVHDRSDVWIIYIVALAYGISFVTISAALNGLLKELLPADLLGDGNGALQTVKEGLRLVAPLLGAGIFAAVGGAAVAMLDAVTFVLGAVALILLKVRETRPAPPELHWTAEMSAGARHLLGDPALRRSVLATGVGLLMIGLAESVGFAVNQLGLHRPPAFIGVLIAVQGAGAVLGGVASAPIIRRLGEQTALGIGLAALGAGLAGWFSTSLIVVMAGEVVLGFGLPVAVVALYTLLQRRTPGPLMGRVSAATDVLIGVPQTISIAVGAVLVSLVDYRILVAVMVVGLLPTGGYLVAVARRDPEPAGTADPDPAAVRRGVEEALPGEPH